MGIINWYYYLSWQKNSEIAKQAEIEQKKERNNKQNKKSSNGVRPHPMQKQLSTLQQGMEMLADEFD